MTNPIFTTSSSVKRDPNDETEELHCVAITPLLYHLAELPRRRTLTIRRGRDDAVFYDDGDGALLLVLPVLLPDEPEEKWVGTVNYELGDVTVCDLDAMFPGDDLTFCYKARRRPAEGPGSAPREDMPGLPRAEPQEAPSQMQRRFAVLSAQLRRRPDKPQCIDNYDLS